MRIEPPPPLQDGPACPGGSLDGQKLSEVRSYKIFEQRPSGAATLRSYLEGPIPGGGARTKSRSLSYRQPEAPNRLWVCRLGVPCELSRLFRASVAVRVVCECLPPLKECTSSPPIPGEFSKRLVSVWTAERIWRTGPRDANGRGLGSLLIQFRAHSVRRDGMPNCALRCEGPRP